MSEGAWDDDGLDDHDDHGPVVEARRDAVDVALPALRSGMDAAVQRAIQKRLDSVAAAAVDEAFDDDVLADLAAVARSGAVDVVSPDQPAALVYKALPDFVEGFLATIYGRNFDMRELNWCPAWWNHPEAVYRLDAIWRAWEHLRKDPTLGSSSWLREHGDPNMAVLMGPEGPFRGCSPDKGHSARAWHTLPLERPPAALYGDDT